MEIRTFNGGDWDRVKGIYESGILTGNATFETTVPEYDVFVSKFPPDLLWVGDLHGEVICWAGLQPVSARKVYQGVMEVTVYVDPKFQGRGFGSSLMSHIIKQSENAGIWTLYASIIEENTASISLHETAGFRKIGFRERIAKFNDKWRNTVIFERRSSINGI